MIRRRSYSAGLRGQRRRHLNSSQKRLAGFAVGAVDRPAAYIGPVGLTFRMPGQLNDANDRDGLSHAAAKRLSMVLVMASSPS